MITSNQEQVKNIFKDTYLFYLKYMDINTDLECLSMMKETNELYNKYPFEMTKTILLQICETIISYMKEREKVR